MKPKLRFPGYEEEWEEKKLGDIAQKFTGGGTPSTKEKTYWINGDIPWIQSSDLLKESITIPTISKKITITALERSSAKKIMANSIAIVTRVGVGKVAYIHHSYATSQDFLSLSGINGDPLFWTYRIKKLMEKQSFYLQGTSIKGITKDEVLKIKVYAPFIHEQKKIGEFFSLLDQRIEKQEEKIELMKERKKGWMQKVFHQEIRFKDENGNDYPDWEEKKLGEVADIKGGYAFKSQEFSYEGVPVITISNINKFIYDNQSFNHSVLSNNQILKGKSGDILVALSGATTGKSGQIKEGNYYINQRIARIRHHHNLNSYLFNWINSNDFNKQLNKLLVAGAQPNLSIIDLKQLLIPLPSIPEQEKIANFLSAQDKLIEKEEEKLNLLKEQKKGLLQQMFV